MHNNFLIDRRGKMSKSSGEFLRLQTLVDKGFHPLAYRIMCLQAHYRSEMEFTWEGLAAAFVRLKRMFSVIERWKKSRALVSALEVNSSGEQAHEPPWWRSVAQQKNKVEIEGWEREVAGRFANAVVSDLNTAEAIPQLESALNYGIFELINSFDQVLGLNLLTLTRADLRIRPAAATLTEATIESRLTERKAARAAKDFATSDRIRDDLIAQGVEVMDGDPLGWDWKLDI